jgi:CxxC motif-containing protein (DUF1111 family)
MKAKIAGLLMFAAFVLAAPNSPAALNVYEPFNYSSLADGTVGTGIGESGNWTCGATPSIVTGLTYPGLSTANSALSSGSSRQFVSFASPLSSGTKWISFLYKASGNMGGNIDGVYFPNGGTGLYFGFGLAPFSGTQGGFGLGSMTTTGSSATGASSLATSFLGTYGTTYLVAMQIQFDTSGNNDTVTVYLNPVANASAPGVSATYTVSSFDVGAIAGIGLNVQGAATITVDEIRVGDTYGDVAGFVAAPPAPTGLTAYPGTNGVGLSWTAVSGATGYLVLRGTSTGVYTVTTSAASNTNDDITAVGGVTYFYVVEATNSSGASPISSEVSATPSIALPGAPGGLTAIGTNGAVNLTWSASTGAASYNVKRSTSSGAEVTITNVVATSYDDAAVANGTTYFYEVSSTNNAGESTNSAEASATPNSPPGAPTGLIAAAGTNQVSLAWTGSAGAASYNVKRSITSGSGYSTIATTTDPTVNYKDTNAIKFTEYFYVVSAVNADGESVNSSPEASATPLGVYGPTAYDSFNYSGGGQINVTTAAPTGAANNTTDGGWTGNWAGGAATVNSFGLSYPGLPTGHNSMASLGANNIYTHIAGAPASGSVWVSFLFTQAGDNGGNRSGVILEDGTGTGIMLSYHQFGSSQGFPCLVAMSGTTTVGSEIQASANLQTYQNTNFYVLQFTYTGGVVSSISVYSDPTAGTSTAPAPDFTIASGLPGFGALVNFGLVDPSAEAITLDEFRVGNTYGDVSGFVTNLVASPVITGVSPATGLTNGGTGVTIIGSNFAAGATVLFGTNAATGFTLTGSTNISATTPAAAPGAVDVIVMNLDGSSATNFNGFTYVLPPPPPIMPSIVPGSVGLSGTNFNFVWLGGTNTSSVLLTSTNLGPGAIWTPVSTNLFGANGLSTDSVPFNPNEPQRYFALSLPSNIVVVLPPTGLETEVSGTTNAIGLDWIASASFGVTGYRIFYGIVGGNVTNTVDVGNVTSAILSGLTPGQNYFVSVITLSPNGSSNPSDASLTAQPDANISVVPLFDATTPLEPDTISNTPTALITWIADRPRARHARESEFMLYDTYLPFYWEQRMTTVEIIDTIGKGGSTITFNMTSLNVLDTPNIRFFFQGQTTVAQYSDNLFADQVNPSLTNWSSTISQNLTFNRALKPGDRIELEFSPFMLTVSNGQLNYYGGAILYVAGQGIVPWQEGVTNDPGSVNAALDSTPMPTNGWIAGGMTMPYQYSAEPNHVFNQMAPNASPPTGEPFVLGRRLHHTDFANGTHSEQPNPVFTAEIGKLGPKFSNVSCDACHLNNSRALPPAIGAPMIQSLVRVGSDAKGTPDPVLGSVLSPQSTTGTPEGGVSIGSYTTINGTYGDGSPYTLQKPNYVFSGHAPAFYSVRLAPQLVGMGLLEAISEGTVETMANADNTNNGGITGRIQVVTDPQTGQPRLGRFGYKAGKARISHQIAGALNSDMGVTTSIFPVLDGDSNSGPVELADSDLTNWTRYVSALGVNARRNLTNVRALYGEQLFASANCVACHTPTLTTSPYHPMAELRNQTIHPYTDLLLHDMGTGLADNMGEANASGSQWRTAPLWSIGLTAGASGGEAYLHDGRARSLAEAILWHGGEAGESEEVFRNMSASDRAALIAFLQSL